MKWNFLYQITAAFRTPDYRGYRPQIPTVCPLSSTEFIEPPHPRKKIPGYATADRQTDMTKLIVAFRNFAKAPKKLPSWNYYYTFILAPFCSKQ